MPGACWELRVCVLIMNEASWLPTTWTYLIPLNCTLKNGKGWYLCYVYFCCCSVTQLCLTLCDRMDCSTPGFPVLHHLLEFAQTHVHWVSDAIQPFHSLSPPSCPALTLSRHQGLLMSHGGQSIGSSASESIFLINMFILPPASAGDIDAWVWFLGREDPLEEDMATHSSILAGESLGQRSLEGYST